MNWPLILIIFISLAAVISLLDWLSGIRSGRSSATGEPELLFPLSATALALALGIWLAVEHEWHWSVIYICPAVAQGAAFAAMNQGGIGESLARLLSGAVWPFSAALLIKAMAELQEQPPTIKAYRIAERTDWEDPVRSKGSQASFEWNCSRLYRLQTGKEQFNYISGKMALARTEKDPVVRCARYLVCADLVHEMKRDGSVEGERVGELHREALDRHHGG